MTILIRIVAPLFALAIMAGVTSARAEEMIGTWLTQQRDAHIQVMKCGKAMCGTVIWLRDAVDAKTGKPPIDSRNPDPSKRARKILGIRIFAMEKDSTDSWTGGIYNSDDGHTYKGRLVPHGENELEVQGCAGALCGSETWTRTK